MFEREPARSGRAKSRGTFMLRFVAAAAATAAVGFVGHHMLSTTTTASGSSGDTQVVQVAALRPLYDGQPSSWQAVQAARQRGQARFEWIYSTNQGDYVVVFDTKQELEAWKCSPAMSILHICKSQERG